MTFRRMLLGAAICLFPVLVLAQTRVPVPAADAQAKAMGLIRDVYKTEYDAAKTPEQQEELAGKLMTMAADLKPSADHYALLRVARDLSVKAGGPLCFQAVDEMAKAYQIDGVGMQAKVLETCCTAARTPEQRAAIVEVGLPLVDAAIAADNPDAAKTVCDGLSSIARRSRDAALLRKLNELRTRIAGVAKAAAAAQTAIETLRTNPNDPEANTIAGKYYCLTKRSWEQGIPMLARGSDAGMKDAAAKELAMKTVAQPTAKDMVAVGDAWWALADAESAPGKVALLAHAASWYEQAIPAGLAGLTKTRVQKRIESLQPEDEKPKVIDLLALVDPGKHAATGAWKKVDGELHGHSDYKRLDKTGASIVLPCKCGDNYQLEFEFTRTEGSNRIAAMVPVGSTQCQVTLSAHGNCSGIELIDGKTAEGTNPSLVKDQVASGQRYRLTIRVRSQGENVEIEADLDGKPHIRWKGAVSQLTPSTRCLLPEPGMLGIGVGPPGPTTVAFHSIKFTNLNGKTPATKPTTPVKPKPMDLRTFVLSTKWIRHGQSPKEVTEFLFTFRPDGTCTGIGHGRTKRGSGHTVWKVEGNTLMFANRTREWSVLQFDPRRRAFMGITQGWRYLMYPAGMR